MGQLKPGCLKQITYIEMFEDDLAHSYDKMVQTKEINDMTIPRAQSYTASQDIHDMWLKNSVLIKMNTNVQNVHFQI